MKLVRSTLVVHAPGSRQRSVVVYGPIALPSGTTKKSSLKLMLPPLHSTPGASALLPSNSRGHSVQLLVSVLAKCLSSQLMHLPVAGLLILFSQRTTRVPEQVMPKGHCCFSTSPVSMLGRHTKPSLHVSQKGCPMASWNLPAGQRSQATALLAFE